MIIRIKVSKRTSIARIRGKIKIGNPNTYLSKSYFLLIRSLLSVVTVILTIFLNITTMRLIR